MNNNTYTLKEMAEILASAFPNDDALKCARKIRHWTSMDLLSTHGKKYTGTGVSREYIFDEIYKAAILMELSRWKVPMPVLADNFETMVDEYENSEDWDTAIEALDNVFLALSWSDDLVNWQLSVSEPKLGILETLDNPQDERYLRTDFGGGLFVETPNSIVVLNITRLFMRVHEHANT
jgi:hypothetical protein